MEERVKVGADAYQTIFMQAKILKNDYERFLDQYEQIAIKNSEFAIQMLNLPKIQHTYAIIESTIQVLLNLYMQYAKTDPEIDNGWEKDIEKCIETQTEFLNYYISWFKCGTYIPKNWLPNE